MLCLCYFVVIDLKSGWQVEVSDQGDVRLWLQTESLSDAAELRLIFNDREITGTPVRTASVLQLRHPHGQGWTICYPSIACNHASYSGMLSLHSYENFMDGMIHAARFRILCPAKETNCSEHMAAYFTCRPAAHQVDKCMLARFGFDGEICPSGLTKP